MFKKLCPVKFSNFKLNLFENFLTKQTQFEKTGSYGHFLIPLKTLKINNRNSFTFFVRFSLLLFDKGVCLLCNKIYETSLKTNQKSNRVNPKKNLLRIITTKKKSFSLCSMTLNY